MDINKTGILLRSLRISKGLTQQQVADQLLVSPKTISKWENGDGLPDISIITAVADLYGITVDDLLRGRLVEMNEEPKKSSTIDKVVTYKVYQKMVTTFMVTLGILILGLLISLIFEFTFPPLLGVLIRVIFLLSAIAVYYIGYQQYQVGQILTDDDRVLKGYEANQTKIKWLNYYTIIILFIYYYAGITWSFGNQDENIFLSINSFAIESIFLVGLLIYAFVILKNDSLNPKKWLAFNKYVFLTLILLVVLSGFYTDFDITTIYSENLSSTRNYYSFVNWMLFSDFTKFYLFRGLSLAFMVIMILYTILTRKSKNVPWVYIVLLIISLVTSFSIHYDLALNTNIIASNIYPMMTLHLPGYIILFFLIYTNHIRLLKLES